MLITNTHPHPTITIRNFFGTSAVPMPWLAGTSTSSGEYFGDSMIPMMMMISL
jgi:hypothetical protein